VEMAQNFWTAIFGCATSAGIAVVLSFLTPQKKSDGELKGLVYSLTPRTMKEDVAWYRRSTTLAIAVLTIAGILTILFW
jgi:solute:Na+ symporter, SSS family